MFRALTRQPPNELALDALDVLIVAYAIYRLLLIVKGTRAMQMGVGLALVFALHQLSRTLGLMTLYTLLDTLLASAVLIVVVIFQSDIRRALMRFGRRPFLSRFKTSQETQVVEEVIKAATQLAHDRIGGLIVFERDAALDEFIEPGTILDANVSKELLVSIFVPSHENPVHDGAAIIREGRLWQAGAFLPLTANPKLDRNLGTRHRAAIGISEETDAVVVVVSEERGQVSICFNGNMVPRLDGAELRKVLLGLFSSRTRKPAAEPIRERTSIPPARPVVLAQPESTGPIVLGGARRDEPVAPEEAERVVPVSEPAPPLEEGPDDRTGPLRVRLDSQPVVVREVVSEPEPPSEAPPEQAAVDVSARVEAAPEIVSTSVPAATEPPKPTSLYADALADAPESEAASEPEEPREIEPSGSPSASAIADAEVSAAEEERDS
ncbi:MAG: TIGR00159 family protein [Deltaproteobacteria bacterium]|nr:TIGR00159 family protein [Deltaproteobacteria bacterium]